MSKSTYYIVQTSPEVGGYIGGDSFRGFMCGWGMNHAARFATVGKAQRVMHKLCPQSDAPRRFPRIIKVTTETKTITGMR